MPFFRRPKPDVPLDALGRPWQSAVDPGLRTGLFDEAGGPTAGSPGAPTDDGDAEDPEVAATRSALDPEIVADLDDFADAVETLSAGDMSRLYAFWRNIDEEARIDAYERAQAAAVRSGRRDVIRLFQDDLESWSRVYSGLGRVASERMLLPTDDSLTANRHQIRPVLTDTMVALTLQDELDDADFDTLFGPWRDAMGEEDDGPSETDDVSDQVAGPPVS